MTKAEERERDRAKKAASTGEETQDKLNEGYVLRYVLACRDEAQQARTERMRQNIENFDTYHLRQDFGEKKPGQSTEVLPKVKMATEQTKAFFQQALADIGDWWKVVLTSGEQAKPDAVITPDEVYKLTNYMLKQAKYFTHIGDAMWYALLGSLAVTQITGRLKAKPKYVTKKQGRGENYKKILEMTEDKTWELAFNSIRQVNYYPDPSPENKLYEIFESFPDKYHVLSAAEGDYAIYDKGAVDELTNWAGDSDDSNGGPTKAQETGQTQDQKNYRPKVKLTRFYGNIVDDETGKLLYENVYVTVANDSAIIQKPTRNPMWHQGSDIIAAPLLTVPGSAWHTALMDSPSKLNQAMTELFNMMLDAGFISVHGIKQVRVDWLEDSSQISDGIRYGDTLKVNAQAPPGAKVLEDLITGQFPQQVFNVSNLLQQEYNASALTTDLRGGITPMRQTSATAVVEQGNTITSVFQGIAKNVEINMVQPELTLAIYNIAQNWDLIDKETFISLFGADRGEALSQLDPEDVFAEIASGMKFEVFGISLTVNQKMEYQKFMTLLQSVGASPLFQEPFLKQYDPGKLLGEIIGTLGIDKKKIMLDQPTAPPPGPANIGQPGQPGAPQGGQPDMMSQVPQPQSGLAGIFGNAGGPQPAEGQVV